MKEDQNTPDMGLDSESLGFMWNHEAISLGTLQMILGHQNIETSQIYSHISDEYLKKV